MNDNTALIRVENLEKHFKQGAIKALDGINTEIKKGESNLPDQKDGGEKALDVSCNNGDASIEFSNK